MFQKAYQIASNFTQPLIIHTRLKNGLVESGLASFVVVNKEGWILTCAHVLQPIKRKQTNEITHFQFWWGRNDFFVNQFEVNEANDIALGKIENFDPSFVKQYPVFANPSNLLPGTSLCKLGFPFHEIKATFNSSKQNFEIQPESFPIPRFPMEGMYTRNVHLKDNSKYIETSTPGLRGQSGGPIFDTNGQVYGIQSQTRHLPLGFTPNIVVDGKNVVENQFLNVGWGIHVEVLLALFQKHKIKYQVANQLA